ncbi:MAG: hypothetical protein HKN33_09060 [Pyrinomonadaceae bacterium]|nr:hypothetical protein [Pyrinomonadaceae bacterium]
MRNIILITVIALIAVSAGCSWRQPAEGTVEVKTIYGEAVDVVATSDGGVYEDAYGWHWRDDYYEVNLRAKTETFKVSASSKDNAGLTLPISITYSIPGDKANVIAYVKKFGLTEDERKNRRTPVIKSRIEDITRKNTAKFDAYELLISQQGIQQEALKDLKIIFNNQLNARIESVVVGKPDFIDDGIEVAGSRVVAAKKKQEEEEALKKAAETRIERLKIEAQTFENPKMYAIELQKLRIQEAQAWSKHQGTLVLGSNASPMIQVK